MVWFGPMELTEPLGHPGAQHMNRAPSVTDNSEHSSSASGQPGPSLLGSDSTIRKGVMWVQQEKLFSRWKERFIILTSSYLHIFKKSTSRLSDMGTFVNKVSWRSFKTLYSHCMLKMIWLCSRFHSILRLMPVIWNIACCGWKHLKNRICYFTYWWYS